MEFLLNEVSVTTTWRTALLSIVLAYILTQVIAAVYAWTYRGMSYSRSMVAALVVSGVVASTLMLAIGNSLARGIGIVGTLALIRFRTNLRDPLDMIFVFAAFGAGIAAGTGSYATGIVGTAMFVLVVSLMRFTSFGAHRQYDGVLRLQLPAGSKSEEALRRALGEHCRRFVLITLREAMQGEALDHSYQVILRRPGDETALVAAVSELEGATGVTIAMQEATVEL